MKRLFPLLLTLLLFPLPGCGLGNGIPRGLDWQGPTRIGVLDHDPPRS